MIQIPLSLATAIAGSPEAFTTAVARHRDAVAIHMMGKPGVAAPVAPSAIAALVYRIPAAGPVAERGPDTIAIAPYEIFDDTPPAPAEPDPSIELALQTLRDTISG